MLSAVALAGLLAGPQLACEQLYRMYDLNIPATCSDACRQLQRATGIRGYEKIGSAVAEASQFVVQQGPGHLPLLQDIGPCSAAAVGVAWKRAYPQVLDPFQQLVGGESATQAVAQTTWVVDRNAGIQRSQLLGPRPVGEKRANLLHPVSKALGGGD